MKKRWNIKIYLPLIIVLAFGLGFLISPLIKNSSKKIAEITNSPQAQNNTNFEGCQSRMAIQKDIYVLFCGNQIRIGWSPEVITFGDKTIEDEKSFPDLFHFPNEKSLLLLEAKSFPQNKELFAVTSTLDTGGSFRQAFGIYRLNNWKVERLMRKNFADIPGRWTRIAVSENAPSFTVSGDLGQVGKYCGACRIEWMDFYAWDSTKQSFILDNVNHRNDYAELLTKYDKLNPDNEELSRDTQGKLNTSKQAVQQILQGQNVSMFDNAYPVENRKK